MNELDGKRVLYHGSLTQYHGEMTLEKGYQSYDMRDGDVRYLLVYGRKMHEYLTNVRRESFTVLDDENGHA